MNEEDIIVRAISLYTFIRTYSYALHISPFELETFIVALDGYSYINSHNPLIDHIHYTLLKLLIENFEGYSRVYQNVDQKLFDLHTWPSYISNILFCIKEEFVEQKELNSKYELLVNEQQYSTHYAEIQNLTECLLLLHGYDIRRIPYCEYDYGDKVYILETIIHIILSQSNIIVNLETRKEHMLRRLAWNRQYKMNLKSGTTSSVICPDERPIDQTKEEQEELLQTLPLLNKGDDGMVEVCILCGCVGNLVCCDYCPAAYHKQCLFISDKIGSSELHLTPSSSNKNGTSINCSKATYYFRCYECGIPDPCRGGEKLHWNSVPFSTGTKGMMVSQEGDIIPLSEERPSVPSTSSNPPGRRGRPRRAVSSSGGELKLCTNDQLNTGLDISVSNTRTSRRRGSEATTLNYKEKEETAEFDEYIGLPYRSPASNSDAKPRGRGRPRATTSTADTITSLHMTEEVQESAVMVTYAIVGRIVLIRDGKGFGCRIMSRQEKAWFLPKALFQQYIEPQVPPFYVAISNTKEVESENSVSSRSKIRSSANSNTHSSHVILDSYVLDDTIVGNTVCNSEVYNISQAISTYHQQMASLLSAYDRSPWALQHKGSSNGDPMEASLSAFRWVWSSPISPYGYINRYQNARFNKILPVMGNGVWVAEQQNEANASEFTSTSGLMLSGIAATAGNIPAASMQHANATLHNSRQMHKKQHNRKNALGKHVYYPIKIQNSGEKMFNYHILHDYLLAYLKCCSGTRDEMKVVVPMTCELPTSMLSLPLLPHWPMYQSNSSNHVVAKQRVAKWSSIPVHSIDLYGLYIMMEDSYRKYYQWYTSEKCDVATVLGIDDGSFWGNWSVRFSMVGVEIAHLTTLASELHVDHKGGGIMSATETKCEWKRVFNKLKGLLMQLSDQIDPRVFCIEWFLTDNELNTKQLSSNISVYRPNGATNVVQLTDNCCNSDGGHIQVQSPFSCELPHLAAPSTKFRSSFADASTPIANQSSTLPREVAFMTKYKNRMQNVVRVRNTHFMPLKLPEVSSRSRHSLFVAYKSIKPQLIDCNYYKNYCGRSRRKKTAGFGGAGYHNFRVNGRFASRDAAGGSMEFNNSDSEAMSESDLEADKNEHGSRVDACGSEKRDQGSEDEDQGSGDETSIPPAVTAKSTYQHIEQSKRGTETTEFYTGNRLLPFEIRCCYVSYPPTHKLKSRTGPAFEACFPKSSTKKSSSRCSNGSSFRNSFPDYFKDKSTSAPKLHKRTKWHLKNGSSYYLKKLARLGGLGFLPHVSYPWEPNTRATAPWYTIWRYRLKKCCSTEQLLLQWRLLEAYINRKSLVKSNNSANVEDSTAQGLAQGFRETKNCVDGSVSISNVTNEYAKYLIESVQMLNAVVWNSEATVTCSSESSQPSTMLDANKYIDYQVQCAWYRINHPYKPLPNINAMHVKREVGTCEDGGGSELAIDWDRPKPHSFGVWFLQEALDSHCSTTSTIAITNANPDASIMTHHVPLLTLDTMRIVRCMYNVIELLKGVDSAVNGNQESELNPEAMCRIQSILSQFVKDLMTSLANGGGYVERSIAHVSNMDVKEVNEVEMFSDEQIGDLMKTHEVYIYNDILQYFNKIRIETRNLLCKYMAKRISDRMMSGKGCEVRENGNQGEDSKSYVNLEEGRVDRKRTHRKTYGASASYSSFKPQCKSNTKSNSLLGDLGKSSNANKQGAIVGSWTKNVCEAFIDNTLDELVMGCKCLYILKTVLVDGLEDKISEGCSGTMKQNHLPIAVTTAVGPKDITFNQNMKELSYYKRRKLLANGNCNCSEKELSTQPTESLVTLQRKPLLEYIFHLKLFPKIPKKLFLHSPISGNNSGSNGLFYNRNDIVCNRILLDSRVELIDRSIIAPAYYNTPPSIESNKQKQNQEITLGEEANSNTRRSSRRNQAIHPSNTSTTERRPESTPDPEPLSAPSYYLPQVGDEIVYFPEGHAEYLKFYGVSSTGANGVGDRRDALQLEKHRSGLVHKYKKSVSNDLSDDTTSLSGGKSNSKWHHWVCGCILSIDYEFPLVTQEVNRAPLGFNKAAAKTVENSQYEIVMVLCIGIFNYNNMHLKPMYLTYKPDHLCGEFLILKDIIYDTLDKHWNLHDEFCMKYDNNGVTELYNGKIVEIHRDDTKTRAMLQNDQKSDKKSDKKLKKDYDNYADLDTGIPIWNGIGVVWELEGSPGCGIYNEELVDFVNEWELIKPTTSNITINKHQNRKKRIEKNWMAVDEKRSSYVEDMLSNSVVSTNAIFDEYLNKFLGIECEDTESLLCSDYEAFLSPVDEELVPGYKSIIPYPISLQCIHTKCKNNYYRSPYSILSDIRLIYMNCITYNHVDSLLSQRAADLYRFFVRQITKLYNGSTRQTSPNISLCVKDEKNAHDVRYESKFDVSNFCLIDQLVLSNRVSLTEICSGVCPLLQGVLRSEGYGLDLDV